MGGKGAGLLEQGGHSGTSGPQVSGLGRGRTVQRPGAAFPRVRGQAGRRLRGRTACGGRGQERLCGRGRAGRRERRGCRGVGRSVGPGESRLREAGLMAEGRSQACRRGRGRAVGGGRGQESRGGGGGRAPGGGAGPGRLPRAWPAC